MNRLFEVILDVKDEFGNTMDPGDVYTTRIDNAVDIETGFENGFITTEDAISELKKISSGGSDKRIDDIINEIEKSKNKTESDLSNKMFYKDGKFNYIKFLEFMELFEDTEDGVLTIESEKLGDKLNPYGGFDTVEEQLNNFDSDVFEMTGHHADIDDLVDSLTDYVNDEYSPLHSMSLENIIDELNQAVEAHPKLEQTKKYAEKLQKWYKELQDYGLSMDKKLHRGYFQYSK